MIEFLMPSTLLLLLLLPGMIAFLLWRDAVRRHRLAQIGDPALVSRLLRYVSHGRRRLRSALWLCALALAIVALARPTAGTTTDTLLPIGAEVVFVVDVSLSMAAPDVAPDRLSRALADASLLARQLPGTSIGIAMFAGIARPYMPATVNPAAVDLFLNSLSTAAIQMQGTALAAALTTAADMFDDSAASPAVIVLFTDGEDHEGQIDVALLDVAQRGIIVHALGYGTEQGSTLPLRDSAGQLDGFKRDASGNLVISTLRMPILEDIAAAASGVALRATDGQALAVVAERIRALQGGSLEPQLVTRPVEAYPLPLTLAALALLAGLLVSPVRKVGLT